MTIKVSLHLLWETTKMRETNGFYCILFKEIQWQMADNNVYSTFNLYIRPQRQIEFGRITREVFSLINTNLLNLPEDSLNKKLVIRYEICCPVVVFPDQPLVSQWRQLAKIFKCVQVIYVLLMNDPYLEIKNPVEDFGWKEGITFTVHERDASGNMRRKIQSSPVNGRPVSPPRITSPQSSLYYLLKSQGCGCSR